MKEQIEIEKGLYYRQTLFDKAKRVVVKVGSAILTAEDGMNLDVIKNLAKEMGFTESALYRHFKGKQEIIVSMLEFLASSMEERFSTLIDSQF